MAHTRWSEAVAKGDRRHQVCRRYPNGPDHAAAWSDDQLSSTSRVKSRMCSWGLSPDLLKQIGWKAAMPSL